MKKISYFVIVLILLNEFTFSQSGWYALSCGLNVDWYSAYFTSNTTGYVAGNDFILKTTDSGNAWTTSLYAVGVRFRHLIFVNQTTGIVIGRDGIILKTTNSGVNWVQKPSGTGNDLLQFYMVNENTGYLCGGFGTYLKTTDCCNSWYGQTLCSTHLYGIFFTSVATGWIVGDMGLMYNTTNGGANWINAQFPEVVDLREIFFLNPTTGWITGKLGRIFCTTNSGGNWISQYSDSNSIYHHIVMRNSSNGWAVGECEIVHTSDLGTHWNRQLYSYPLPLVQSFFTSDLVGYVVGFGGTIYKTTNGGEPVGIQPISSEIPIQFSLSQNYPNPFNPVTKIKFDIPTPLNPPFAKGGTAKPGGFVKLAIYDILGREVIILVNEQLKPGTYEVAWDASNYPSGVYFYKLSANGFVQTKRMVLIK